MNNMGPMFFPNQNNIDIYQEIRSLENRMCSLEKDIINLNNKLNNIEKVNQQKNTNMYDTNKYNMM